jgi:hypothetical protein
MRRREAIAGILAAVGGGSLGCNKVSSGGRRTAGAGQPTLDDLRLDAQAIGIELSDTELQAIHAYAADFLKTADRISKAATRRPRPNTGRDYPHGRRLPKIRSAPGT